MSTIKLTYNLPDEREELDHAMNGLKYYLAIVEIGELLRKYRKYHDSDVVETDRIEREFYEILESRGVDV